LCIKIWLSMLRVPFEILLVEDNPSDVELVQEALSVWNSPPHLSAVDDGEKAVRFLHRKAPYADAPAPELILLDLNLPKKDGIEVLREIKADERLSMIPVIVLTTSDREHDVKKAYSMHANCYLTKPLEIDEFIEKVRAIEQFWLNHARLPRSLTA
jgi:two-component system, chemotaxis family, response regulator Rcp1